MNATEINHTRFEYHAKPADILFGFILTGVSLLLIPVLTSVSPTLGLLMMLVVLILMPYALIRLWNFNVRNTSFRTQFRLPVSLHAPLFGGINSSGSAACRDNGVQRDVFAVVCKSIHRTGG